MSYIQIELGGKLQGLKFNQLSIEIFTANINYEAIDTSSIYAIFFAGITGNYYAKRKEVDFTFENVCDWVDEVDKDIIVKVCDMFAETNAYKQWFAEFSAQIRQLAAEPEAKAEETKKKIN